jgi:hypothetical protein
MAGTTSTGRAIHVDRALSNILVNRKPEGFIVDQLVPITTVGKQTDFYWKYDHNELRRFEAGLDVRAPGGVANLVGFTVQTDTYVVKNYALGAEWVVEDEVNADEELAWAEYHTIVVAERLHLSYEMRVADLAVNTTNVGTVTTINSAWSDAENSSPFDDINQEIENFRKRTGEAPNTMIIPSQVGRDLRANAQLRSLLFGDGGGLVTERMFADLFQVPTVLMPSAQVNTQGEQETINSSATLSDIWGPHLWLANINLLSGRMVDTWLNAFRWTSPKLGTPMAIRRLPFDQERLTQKIDGMYWQDEKIVSADLAVRVADVSSNW